MIKSFFSIFLAFPILIASQEFHWYWPVDGTLNEDHFILNYMDHGGTVDYTGGRLTYSGHGGTDFCLFPIKRMERGVVVRAVADGYVTRADNLNSFDRTFNSGVGANNTVEIIHNDSLSLFYSHNRYNSLMVRVGDSVRRGQPLAFIGSAGNSSIPHLHFEIDTPAMDPFDVNKPQRFWDFAVPYSPTVFGVRDLQVFTVTALGFPFPAGTAFSVVQGKFNGKLDSAKLHPPRIFGSDESRLFVYWSTHNRPVTGQVSVRILDPDDSLFFDTTYTASRFPTVSLVPFFFNGRSGSGKHGLWKARLEVDGQVRRSIGFTVGPASVYAPLLTPISGFSFRVPSLNTLSAFVLLTDSLSGNVTYRVAVPTNAIYVADTTLSRHIIRVRPFSDQPYRSAILPILAENGTGFADTFFFHLVDFSKPFKGDSTALEHLTRLSGSFSGLRFANPYEPGRPIGIPAMTRQTEALDILTVAGRLVRRYSLSKYPGKSLSWDGRDFLGRTLPAGLYLFRRHGGSFNREQKVILIP